MRLVVVFAVAAGLAFAGGADLLTGVVDTVGGTTYDNQNSGPSLQMVAADPAYGIHVTWTYSIGAQGSGWPNRSMYYNFYDRATGGWNWFEPSDFMSSGVNSQSRRTGYGTLDLDPTDGAALIGCHYNAGGMPPHFTPTVQRDLAPGVGLFSECIGEPTLTDQFLPVLGVTPDRTIHFMLIGFQMTDNLYYSRSTFWCTWDDPVNWNQTGAFGHNLTASHASNKLLATWMSGHDDSAALSYRYSSDAGATWNAIQQLTPPDAFGGDTGSVCVRGAAGLFDRDDNWHLVTTVLPVIGDSAYPNPAELWLFSSAGDGWHRIHRAGSENLAGGFGSHAAICDRPSLGQNPATGRFFATWEQFDSSNVEASTGLLRADVWLAWSDDGTDWSEPTRLTEPDGSSKRFPNIARDCTGDSLAVSFVQDMIAGFNVDEVGAVSNNPVCVWRGQGVGIAEQPPAARSTRPRATIAHGILRLPKASGVLLDIAGRPVLDLVPGANDIRHLAPGVYFIRGEGSRGHKVVIQR